jgi:hypothetical protein
MILNFYYDTTTKAIEELAKQGYLIDFNLEENVPSDHGSKFNWAEFNITSIYRYEGDSDPADEMIIYAISSSAGIKGILVAGYGVSNNDGVDAILNKLSNNKTIT